MEMKEVQFKMLIPADIEVKRKAKIDKYVPIGHFEELFKCW